MSEIRPGGPSLSESGNFSPDMLPEVQREDSGEKEAIAGRILERVISEVELEDPTELDREKTHEAKDEPSQFSAPAAPMQSVGSILQQQNPPAEPIAIPSSKTAARPAQAMGVQPITHARIFTYRIAVRYGAIAGVVVAALLVLAS